MNIFVAVGRVLFSALFIGSGLAHFNSSTIAYAATSGVPLPNILVPLSGLLIVVGGLMVALGWHTRLGAACIIVFLIPVTLTMHRFWGLTDPDMAMQQQAHFMKNLSMLGAAMIITYFGGGPASLDQRAFYREHLRVPEEKTTLKHPAEV